MNHQATAIRKMKVSEKLSYISDLYQDLYKKEIDEGGHIISRVRDSLTKTTGLLWPTLSKYIKIHTSLHPDLVPYLDKKGQEKLSLGVALKLVEDVLNPTYQLEIYPELIPQKNADVIRRGVESSSTCLICCTPSPVMEKMPCCGQFLCDTCLLKDMETSINSLAFTGLRCVFCKSYFSKAYSTWFLCKRDWLRGSKAYQLQNDDQGSMTFRQPWRKTDKYWAHIHKYGMARYSWNLWKKLESMLSEIELANREVEVGDYRTLFEGEMYYGPCTRCTPGVREYALQDAEFGHLRMCGVEKQCANGEGEEVVLNDDMFVCFVCKSFEENYEDGTFKKCPHCGIKTLKPSGCNYVRCGDHRWCFICNERLEVSHDGHNTHYYTGPGSSAYSSVCRQSLRSDKPKFILNSCDCSSCAPYGGAPLCRELECMERTYQISETEFSLYCKACDNPFQLMAKYYRDPCREPSLSELYTP